MSERSLDSRIHLEGTLFRANRQVGSGSVDECSEALSGRFVDRLERCLVELCAQMAIPIPLWLSKNTREFARFHQTVFFAEQFREAVPFDRFQIRYRS